MVDREKVIADIEEQIAWIRDNDFHKFPGWGHTVLAMKDALALLKKPEVRTIDRHELLTNFEAWWKKQEAEQELQIGRYYSDVFDIGYKAGKESIVRCKDCKYRGDRHKCIVAFVAEKQEMPFFFYDNRGEWFCADGVAKDINVLGKESR